MYIYIYIYIYICIYIYIYIYIYICLLNKYIRPFWLEPLGARAPQAQQRPPSTRGPMPGRPRASDGPAGGAGGAGCAGVAGGAVGRAGHLRTGASAYLRRQGGEGRRRLLGAVRHQGHRDGVGVDTVPLARRKVQARFPDSVAPMIVMATWMTDSDDDHRGVHHFDNLVKLCQVASVGLRCGCGLIQIPPSSSADRASEQFNFVKSSIMR